MSLGDVSHCLVMKALLLLLSASALAQTPSATPASKTPPSPPAPAIVTSIHANELAGYETYPRPVQALVESALALTRKDLTYRFGSSDPTLGGMDCSGAIYHVLRFNGIMTVPRQSNAMASWVKSRSALSLTPTATQFSHAELDSIRPGHLVFWTRTWETPDRGDDVSHVMLYLGKHKTTGKPLVWGSSDGRTYSGSSRRGVSVFDFTLPSAASKSRLHGYGPVPGLLPTSPPAPAPTAAVMPKPEVKLASVVTAPPTLPKETILKPEVMGPPKPEVPKATPPKPIATQSKPKTTAKPKPKPKPPIPPQLDPRKALKKLGDSLDRLLR
jgi:cell wall-associated NlpC family hydrolase